MTTSIWQASADKTRFPAFSGEEDVDVVVIGGGITGITSALLLAKAGRTVIVLEALETGLGTTGCSTGNLYATVDSLLSSVKSSWDRRTSAAVVSSRADTLQFIERTIAEHHIACDLVRCPLYLFSLNEAGNSPLRQEYETLLEAGLKAAYVNTFPLPFAVSPAIRLEQQAQFNPLLYIRVLAQAIRSDTCRIFEHSKVTAIDHHRLTVSTAQGLVHAKKIIMATHTPKGFEVHQTVLGPYREYALAARLTDDRYPEGIFWSIDEPGYSLRSFSLKGARHLLVIGEKHKTGQQEEGVDYFKRVEEFTRSRFSVGSVEYRWSAQHYRSADTLPYIGRTAASGDVYIATGFGTDGLIYGSLAARMITADILGRENPWKDLYRATRFEPVRSAKDFLTENMNVAKQYVGDYVTKRETVARENIQPGEGGIVRSGRESSAVHRDKEGGVTELSPICTHLGCMVHWNSMEKSWDCPCHGSRFRTDGEVIEGPAIKALQKKGEP